MAFSSAFHLLMRTLLLTYISVPISGVAAKIGGRVGARGDTRLFHRSICFGRRCAVSVGTRNDDRSVVEPILRKLCIRRDADADGQSSTLALRASTSMETHQQIRYGVELDDAPLNPPGGVNLSIILLGRFQTVPAHQDWQEKLSTELGRKHRSSTAVFAKTCSSLYL